MTSNNIGKKKFIEWLWTQQRCSDEDKRFKPTSINFVSWYSFQSELDEELKDFKAHKSLKANNHYISGWMHEISIIPRTGYHSDSQRMHYINRRTADELGSSPQIFLNIFNWFKWSITVLALSALLEQTKYAQKLSWIALWAFIHWRSSSNMAAVTSSQSGLQNWGLPFTVWFIFWFTVTMLFLRFWILFIYLMNSFCQQSNISDQFIILKLF